MPIPRATLGRPMRMHSRVLPRAASIAIAALLTLSACSSDEPEAAPKPSATPSETVASETPEPSESATPEAETAEEFIRRWPVVETAMINTGDAADTGQMTQGCEPCLGTRGSRGGLLRERRYARRRPPGRFDPSRCQSTARPRRDFIVRTVAQPTEYQSQSLAPSRDYEGGPMTIRSSLLTGGASGVWSMRRSGETRSERLCQANLSGS